MVVFKDITEALQMWSLKTSTGCICVHRLPV